MKSDAALTRAIAARLKIMVTCPRCLGLGRETFRGGADSRCRSCDARGEIEAQVLVRPARRRR